MGNGAPKSGLSEVTLFTSTFLEMEFKSFKSSIKHFLLEKAPSIKTAVPFLITYLILLIRHTEKCRRLTGSHKQSQQCMNTVNVSKKHEGSLDPEHASFCCISLDFNKQTL